MKARRPEPEPTLAELQVLKLLWRELKLSAREVHERLGADRSWAYSTTRTTLDRMVRKGLLARTAFHGLHLYAAAVSRPRALARLARDFAERVLDLEGSSLVPLFARSKRLTPEEVEELAELLRSEGEKGER